MINRTTHSLSLSHTCIAEPLTWNNSLTARQRHKQLETLYQKYPPLWYIIFPRPHPPGRPAITPHPPGDNSTHTRQTWQTTGVCVWDMGLNTLSLTFYHTSLSAMNLNRYSPIQFLHCHFLHKSPKRFVCMCGFEFSFLGAISHGFVGHTCTDTPWCIPHTKTFLRWTSYLF